MQMKFMHEAIIEAKIAIKQGNIPIGCVIVYKNEIVARAHNAEFWHAEILAIQMAQKKLGKFLNKCEMFVTIKPCKMCMHAAKLARIRTIVYGCDNKNEPLPNVEIIENIAENECKELMQEWFKKKR